ncbi:aminotransferase class V-fold PLP-dependent enzyme [Paenibacillus sp. HJGM_3]|uniref:aminotransferase class V-fold PLP-dependent enzyme n=1 Tax=Paenibacillus sp. HJGM_3 TaxID=3379816 RepID=UPI00385E2DEA
MKLSPLIPKSAFHGLERVTWLYSGAETPPLQGAAQALEAYIRNRELGPDGRAKNAEIEQSLRKRLAQLLNGRAQDIALVSNASEAITLFLQSLRLQAGDNIVLHTLEFPSGMLPVLLLQELGVELRLVPHRDWQVSGDDLFARVDARTRLVLTSHVSFVSGVRLDYRSLYARLRETQTLLLLDATQSLGAVPVDLQAADAVVCSSYKWLMSLHGLGVLALNPARLRDLRPASAGWRSVQELFHADRFATFEYHDDARRFELGFPNYPAIYTMNFSAELLLGIGIDRVEAQIERLAGYLIARLSEAGYEVMTPREPERRAGNVSFVCEQGELVAARLQGTGIYVWGGDGRLRASVHAFNDSDDIDRLIAALPAAAAAEGGSVHA